MTIDDLDIKSDDELQINEDSLVYSHLPFIPSFHGATLYYKNNGLRIPAPRDISQKKTALQRQPINRPGRDNKLALALNSKVKGEETALITA